MKATTSTKLLGILPMRDRIFFIAEDHGYEGESYRILELKGSRIKHLLVTRSRTTGGILLPSSYSTMGFGLAAFSAPAGQRPVEIRDRQLVKATTILFRENVTLFTRSWIVRACDSSGSWSRRRGEAL